jgi:hypothetical protein
VSRLQQRTLGAGCAAILQQDAEDGSDRAADIEVRRAVERIEQHAVLALLRIVIAQDDGLFILFRGDDRDTFATAQRTQQDLVGDHVQLLLLFALHVLIADRTEHIVEPGTTHVRRNHLCGNRQR